ncbi:MAG TPA: hypothetical protein VGP26_21050 [Actinophytocola sp.]|jgi:hypothetical protein|nr:hypothetical protein [Actinophytocola sp.]
MTDSVKGAGGPPGPPWSVDVLADLHAGALDPAESARLWPQVNTDPQARAVLAALDEVKIGLGRLGNAPAEPMPGLYAARLDAALDAEMRASGRVATAPLPPQSAPTAAPVVDLSAVRRRRNRMAAWGAGVLTAAAAAAAVAFVALPGQETGGTPSAEGGKTTEAPGGTQGSGEGTDQPLALSKDNLGAAIGGLNGKKDYGDLRDAQGLKACLDAHQVPSSGEPVGVGPVKLDGKPGIAALLGAGTQPGHFRVVVVEPTCSADDPGKVLANAEVP